MHRLALNRLVEASCFCPDDGEMFCNQIRTRLFVLDFCYMMLSKLQPIAAMPYFEFRPNFGCVNEHAQNGGPDHILLNLHLIFVELKELAHPLM